ncbi:MAG: phasin family protein [Pseudomonadota bacterium]
MFTAPNQFAAFQQAAVDNFVRIASVQLESTRRLADLNFSTARELVEESVKNVQTLTNVKDLKEAVTLQTANVKPNATKSLAYSRGVYEILAQANTELKDIGEAQVAEINKQVATALDNVAKSAPAGSEPIVAFVKSTVSAATNALDQVVKVNKQLAAAAESNAAAAFAAVEKPLA